MTGHPTAAAVAAIALLDDRNRRRLYRLVAASEKPVGRDEASAALGISRELAAFHLDRLVAAGLLETEYRRRGRGGPGAGRPAKLYRRGGRVVSVSVPPRDYQRAAHVLADALARLGPAGTEAVAVVARQRGAEVGAEARRTAGPRPGRRRLLAALQQVFEQAGYEPVVDKGDGAIRLRNCPYRSLAESQRPLTCGMNVAWAEGVLSTLRSPNLEVEYMPQPDGCCVILRPTVRKT